MPFLQLADFTMHYEIEGTGLETIVAVHGNLASMRWWDQLSQLLEHDYRVVRMDLRGCGQSSWPNSGFEITQYAQDIHSLVEHLALDRFDLIGHSMGGQIALQYVSEHSPQVKTLALVDSVPAAGLTLTSESRLFFRNIQRDQAALRQALISCFPYLDDNHLINRYCEDASSCAPEVYFQNPETMHDTVLIQTAGQVKVPALILHGREDVIIPVAAMQTTIDAMTKARVILLENCGHSPFVEVPHIAVAAYLQFLSEYQ